MYYSHEMQPHKDYTAKSGSVSRRNVYSLTDSASVALIVVLPGIVGLQPPFSGRESICSSARLFNSGNLVIVDRWVTPKIYRDFNTEFAPAGACTIHLVPLSVCMMALATTR